MFTPSRPFGKNPRAMDENPRALGINPRALAKAPVVAATVIRDGQTYQTTGNTKRFSRRAPGGVRSGKPRVNLIQWKSRCCDCGEPFTFYSTQTLQNPRRRCSLHSR